MTAVELANRMNDFLLKRTGRAGDLTDRTIRRFLSGESRWPHSRTQLALTEIFGSTAEELGFIRRTFRGSKEEETTVHRRTLLTGAPAVAASIALPIRRNQIGMSDVKRFRATLTTLSDSDDKAGGNERLEQHALFRADQAMGLLREKSASPRVASAVYAVAAEAMNLAAWFALEVQQPEKARRHLTEALTHAGMSGDPVAVLHSWDKLAMLSYRGGETEDAKAASRRARATSIARRDPLFYSLGHVRSATACARAGEKQEALRHLGEAGEALTKARPEERPRWSQFYDEAELAGLTASAHLHLGMSGEAEYHYHKALSLVRPELKRNRSVMTVRLAIAQLWQGEPELACATVDGLKPAGLPVTARTEQELTIFRRVLADSGSPHGREWLENVPSGSTEGSV